MMVFLDSFESFSQSSTMLLPSAVSSFNEVIRATSTKSDNKTPFAGIRAVACRFPRVIVPVLSKIKTPTFPAASTARPEMAMTFNLNILTRPAIAIAGNKPPMVVGARQTNKAMMATKLTSLKV